jgi:hypothetical protein
VNPFDFTIEWLGPRAILCDAQGRIWVAAYQNGLYRFDPEVGWTNYTYGNSGGLVSNADALALDPRGQVWIGSSQGRLLRFDPEAALPVKSIPAVRFGASSLVPAILLSIVFLRRGGNMPASSSQEKLWRFIHFSFGFVVWYLVGISLWGFIQYSHEQSGGQLFINPLIILAPVVHILLIVFLYATVRQMARGAFLAIVVNLIGMVFMLPFGAGSVGSTLFAAVFMRPFFVSL